MDHNLDLYAVADAVMAAHELIKKQGTREMKALSRTLLFTIGREIARRSEQPQGVDIRDLDGGNRR
ncbi:hypothetical protein MKK69_25550 [Methylobacterium sp. J-026]|uniref:hypothetical protein n=1 Tax=Methylobacterium sp. J-026 TaxID=2836624 RepID=UPI001FBAF1D3|nr:hypothetical protein [Methylobacterium sp. J-026]MCJ2137369.1 hypothetical protein [Methylobacterium sp. J-026]